MSPRRSKKPTQEQEAHGSTMQMHVSLGEEGSGTVVEKHMGLGHSNVHLGENRDNKAQIFSNPGCFFFFVTSKFKTTDRQVEGEESFSISSQGMIANRTVLLRAFSQKSANNSKIQFFTLVTISMLATAIQAYLPATG